MTVLLNDGVTSNEVPTLVSGHPLVSGRRIVLRTSTTCQRESGPSLLINYRPKERSSFFSVVSTSRSYTNQDIEVEVLL